MATTEETSEFWQGLLALLRSRGWSQRKLSVETGIPTQTIQRWKTGAPGRDHLMLVSRVLGKSMDELMGARAGDARREGLARIAGVDAVSVMERAKVAALRLLPRPAENFRDTNPSHVGEGGTNMNDEEMKALLTSEMVSELTRDQVFGLALLIDVPGIEAWRVQAALELLFPPDREA